MLFFFQEFSEFKSESKLYEFKAGQIFHTQFKRVELTGMKSMGRLMYRENALDTIFVKVAVQKVVSVFVGDNFMVGEAVFHVI